MVQVKAFVKRVGSNAVSYAYIDQAARAIRRARMTKVPVEFN